MEKSGTVIIANIAGSAEEDYVETASRLNGTSVDMIELNISCPNVKEGGASFGTSAASVEKITSAVKKASEKPLMVKLTPNVTDITAMALAAESAGAVFPVALRMVWQTASKVKIPVVGLGGITKWEDAVQMRLAGASAVQVGTASFTDAFAPLKIIDGINNYLDKNGYKSVSEIVGKVEPW